MQFDYSKLLGRMTEFGYTQDSLAKEIGISATTMSLKLNNRSFFGQREIRAICKVLKIDMCDIGAYFFAPKVRKTRTRKGG